MPGTLQQFFLFLLDAFRRRDAVQMTECFVLPCVFGGGGGPPSVYDARDDLARHFEAQNARYRDAGLNAERFTIRSLLMLGDDDAVVNVAWTLRGSGGRFRTFHTAYNLHRAPGGWHIWAVTEHEPTLASGTAED